MQRLHEEDLVGHVLRRGGWKVLRFPAIAEKDETYEIQTPLGARQFQRRAGEALHPKRESLEVIQQQRAGLGEYNFAGQYQQRPAPLEGGIIKRDWLQYYRQPDLPGLRRALEDCCISVDCAFNIHGLISVSERTILRVLRRQWATVASANLE